VVGALDLPIVIVAINILGRTQARVVGGLLVPLLVRLGGSMVALIGTAAILPLAALACARSLVSPGAEAPVPAVEIAILRSLPLFAELQRTNAGSGTALHQTSQRHCRELG